MVLKPRHRRCCLAALAALLTACGFDPNILNQTTFQVVDGRRLMVGYTDGIFDPAPFETDTGEVISPFPIIGADGIRVRDEGDVVLTEDDGALALLAALRHCAEFGQRLATGTGVFYPAEASWLFGRCVE